jgi:hypothetical protein
MRQIGQVDLATGEILEGATLAVVYARRKNGFREGWVAMAQDAMTKLAVADLGHQATRVLLVLLGRLDFENELVIVQAELGRQLSMPAPNVSRAITRLVDEGVLLTGPRIANRCSYRLNPSYGWKGSARNHQEALQARMRAAGLSVVGQGEEAPGEAVDPRQGHLPLA